MPPLPLISFTNWRDTPFVGQLHPSFTTHLGQLIQTPDNPNAYELTTLDEGPCGNVRFVTTAEVTGQSIEDLPESAVCRMLCLYIVTRLDETYLKDACGSLIDIFSWQINETYQTGYEPRRSQHTVSTITRRQQAPFVSDE